MSVNDCCKNLDNHVLIDIDETKRLSKSECKVCGRNHYRMRPKSGALGARFSPLGS